MNDHCIYFTCGQYNFSVGRLDTVPAKQSIVIYPAMRIHQCNNTVCSHSMASGTVLPSLVLLSLRTQEKPTHSFFTGRMPFLLLWHCWLGDRNGIRPVKKTGCWFVGGDDLTGALYVIPPVVTTTSIILSSNKIQTGDILVPANAGPHGKWPLMEWVWKLRRTWIRYTAQRIRQIRINLHLLWSMPSL